MIISHGKLVVLDTAENLIGNEETEKTVELEVKGDSEKILDILKNTDGVTSASCDKEKKILTYLSLCLKTTLVKSCFMLLQGPVPCYINVY